MKMIHGIKLDSFTEAYIDCGYPLDEDYSTNDLSAEALRQIVEDCKAFQDSNADDIGPDSAQAGHDFWLTRNRHGAGFWDGDWDGDVGKRLTECSHAYGECYLYVGDDGLIYIG